MSPLSNRVLINRQYLCIGHVGVNFAKPNCFRKSPNASTRQNRLKSMIIPDYYSNRLDASNKTI